MCIFLGICSYILLLVILVLLSKLSTKEVQLKDIKSDLSLTKANLEFYMEKYKHADYLLQEEKSNNLNMSANVIDLNIEIHDLKQKLKGKGKK